MSREYPCVHYDNQKCKLYGTEDIDWCVMGPCSKETPSNGDHVRDMTDEALAEFLDSFAVCKVCSEREKLEKSEGENCDGECEQHLLEWLKAPHKEEV